MGWTIDQTSHRLLCDALRETVHAGPGALDSPGSIRYWASAVLYMLLLDHPVDQRGRCRSCRRSGAMIGLRRRPCRVHARASYWLLRQPDDTLLSHLANEVGEDSVNRRYAHRRSGTPDGPATKAHGDHRTQRTRLLRNAARHLS